MGLKDEVLGGVGSLPRSAVRVPVFEESILECEVKWVLGRISMKKPSVDDGVPARLFQILKDDAVKILHSIF